MSPAAKKRHFEQLKSPSPRIRRFPTRHVAVSLVFVRNHPGVRSVLRPMSYLLESLPWNFSSSRPSCSSGCASNAAIFATQKPPAVFDPGDSTMSEQNTVTATVPEADESAVREAALKEASKLLSSMAKAYAKGERGLLTSTVEAGEYAA